MIRQSIATIVIASLAACGQESPPAPPDPASIEDAAAPVATRPVAVVDARELQNTRNLLDAYRAESGKSFTLLVGDEALSAEDGDLIILSSLASLWDLAEKDGFRPVFSATLDANVPSVLRDSEQRWIGLSFRPRAVFYREDLIGEDELETLNSYAALGDERWGERLCIASSSIAGNRALVAFLIDRLGERDAELVVRKWRANLAMTPFADDAALIAAVEAGDCHVAIGDWNQLGVQVSRNAESRIVPLVFENAGDMFVDVSGAGVSRHAANPEAATALLEWLASTDANALFAIQANETPANSESSIGNSVLQWGDAGALPESVADLGFRIEEADLLIIRAGYQ